MLTYVGLKSNSGPEIRVGFDIRYSAVAGPIPAKVLEAGKKLKAISRHGVGYDNIDVAVSR